MKKNIILDTDWWTDCDDCVAVRVLANAHKKGIINFLGANIDTYFEKSPYSLELFAKECGLTDFEIAVDYNAVDKDKFPKENCYQHKIIEKFGSFDVLPNKKYNSSVSFYRKLLSNSEEKTDIIAIGFQNSLADLLKSEADDISPLSGFELVKNKVNKLWAMAGKWDVENGAEYNIAHNNNSVYGGIYVSENWPTEITFLGFEVGESVITGGNKILKDENDVLRVAMEAHGSSKGRSSWDPMTAMLAIIGNEDKAGYFTVTGQAKIDENGRNNFIENPNGKHKYIIKKFEDNYYSEQINNFII